MSSYINTGPFPAQGPTDLTVEFDWRDYTRRRLEWLYGPNQAVERRAQTQADVAAWNRLGRRPAA